MLTYLLGMGWIYLIMVVQCFNRDGRPLLFFIGMIPLMGIACFRGIVGTDTYAYFWAFAEAGNGYDYGGEPFFKAVVQALWEIRSDPWFVLFGISAIISSIFVVAITKLNNMGWILALIAVPIFYLDMTMNGLRYGLAFSLFMLATHYLVKGQSKIYIVIAIIGACSHFSSFLLFAIYYAMRRGVNVFVGIAGVVGVFLGVFVLQDYLMDKRELYSSIVSPGALSGVFPFVVSILMIWCALCYRKSMDVSAKALLVCLCLAVSTFALARVSYAGLRFQFMVIMLISTYVCTAVWRGSRNQFIRFGLIMAMVGVIGLGGRIRNMIEEEGLGNSPFFPYQSAPYMKNII